jgi:hypothetical protein
MTTLVYVKDTMPPQFKSLGSRDFPKGRKYTLRGKFPLDSFKDLYINTGVPHRLNRKPVQLHGYDLACRTGHVNEYTRCKINVKTIPKYKTRRLK